MPAVLPTVQARALPRPNLLPATLLMLAAVLAWDGAGLDLPLAQAIGDANGFALREHWLLSTWLHDGGRWLSWLFASVLCLGVWWPFGPLLGLDASRRLQLAVGCLAAAFLISALKAASQTSCPWDLASFGGVAHYTSHWSGGADGGAGHCFPAGHASSGFAFLGGYFVFRDADARMARRWLVAAAICGFILGVGQQLRGAHFMSHTLWTGWICWTLVFALDRFWPRTAAARWSGLDE
jgi:membrane-associated PAP2 superfamily phosphatase